jgi:transposase
MTGTTQREESTRPTSDRLLMAIELGRQQWKVGFTTQLGQHIHRRTLRADAWNRLAERVAVAKQRLGLPTDAAVTSCYEAGRDGFWIHRHLMTLGLENLVVDSSSIEVNRRARRAKTDAIDLAKLLSMLRRHLSGEKNVGHVVHVPTEEDEARRQPHRELWTLKRERTRVTNRMTSLLATVGVSIKVNASFPTRVDELRQWDGPPLSAPLRARVAHEWEKVALFTAHLDALERARRRELRERPDAAAELVRQLLPLRGIGEHSAWVFVTELFAWRRFRNRREVGGSRGWSGRPLGAACSTMNRGSARPAISESVPWPHRLPGVGSRSNDRVP